VGAARSGSSEDSHGRTTREAMIGCHILNRMAELGRPESDAVVS